jgi:hypothetical protein
MSELTDAQRLILVTAGKLRIVASGTVNIAAVTTVTQGPFTRVANERLQAFVFVQQDVAGLQWSDEQAVAAAVEIAYHFQRTANANEAELQIRNGNAASARDVDWLVLGIVP